MDEQNQTTYNQFRNHLLEGRNLSFMQFDKAVLTLSSGGLILSLTFIHKIVPIFNSIYIWSLVIAWILFVLSATATLISFLSSQSAFDRQLQLAEEYYVKNNDKALQELNKPEKVTKLLNIASASAFVLAVSFLLFFVSTNIVSKKEVNMPDNKKSVKITNIQKVMATLQNIEVELGDVKTTLEDIDKKGILPARIPVKPSKEPAQPSTDESPASDINIDSSDEK